MTGKTGTTTATADASGNYTINVPLFAGTNTFKRQARSDAFGQKISGTIQPVTYAAPTAVAPPTT